MQPDPQLDGRTRRRLEAMRRAQAVALDLFEARGYDAVTVEEVAAGAQVGAATLYRNFGTKERLVLWDGYDPLLFEGLAARLSAGEAPLPATQEALSGALEGIYREDRARILRRSRLVLAHPALKAAAASDRAELHRGLAALYLSAKACRDALEAEVVAGAVVGALEAGVAHWVREEGRRPLRQVLRRAFRHLVNLGGRGG
jgi:AcrR family transcriptional regulator